MKRPKNGHFPFPLRWGSNSGAAGGVPERAVGGRLVGGHAPGTDRPQDVSAHPAVQRTLPPGTTHHPVTAPPQGQPLLARQGTFRVSFFFSFLNILFILKQGQNAKLWSSPCSSVILLHNFRNTMIPVEPFRLEDRSYT